MSSTTKIQVIDPASGLPATLDTAVTTSQAYQAILANRNTPLAEAVRPPAKPAEDKPSNVP
jgi:hypothetical protein